MNFIFNFSSVESRRSPLLISAISFPAGAAEDTERAAYLLSEPERLDLTFFAAGVPLFTDGSPPGPPHPARFSPFDGGRREPCDVLFARVSSAFAGPAPPARSSRAWPGLVCSRVPVVAMPPLFATNSFVLYAFAVIFVESAIAVLQEAGTLSPSPVASFPRVEWLRVDPTLAGLERQGTSLLLGAATLPPSDAPHSASTTES